MQHHLEIRVRYNETDGQGRVHHAQYLNYFERGRVELMREMGHSYKEFEATGLMLVVAEMNVQYVAGAEFDDVLHLSTKVDKARGASIYHSYRVVRQADQQLIVEGTSRIACIDKQGQVRRLPEFLRASSP